MLKFQAILFDLDGTLLDSNMENFLPHYFARLAARVTDIAPPKAFIAHLLAATEHMLANDGRVTTNEEVFAAAFYPFAGHSRALSWSRSSRTSTSATSQGRKHTRSGKPKRARSSSLLLRSATGLPSPPIRSSPRPRSGRGWPGPAWMTFPTLG